MNSGNIAMRFRMEISDEKGKGYRNWSWEHFVPGPLDAEECDFISKVAGCWYYDNRADSVRFYTNHNHPMWR